MTPTLGGEDTLAERGLVEPLLDQPEGVAPLGRVWRRRCGRAAPAGLLHHRSQQSRRRR